MTHQAAIDWKGFTDEASVQRALEERVSPSASPNDVQSFAAQQGLECSDVVNGVIFCSTPAPSKLPFTRAKWLMEFHFEQDRLKRIIVTLGLIGP